MHGSFMGVIQCQWQWHTVQDLAVLTMPWNTIGIIHCHLDFPPSESSFYKGKSLFDYFELFHNLLKNHNS